VVKKRKVKRGSQGFFEEVKNEEVEVEAQE